MVNWRATVVIDRNGKVGFYSEVPMREARKLEDLERQVAQASA